MALRRVVRVNVGASLAARASRADVTPPRYRNTLFQSRFMLTNSAPYAR